MLILAPKVWQKTIIEQMAPGRPIMTAISANIIFVCDLVVQKSFMQCNASDTHSTVCFLRALTNKQVINFFIDVGIVEEFCDSFLAVNIAAARDSEARHR